MPEKVVISEAERQAARRLHAARVSDFERKRLRLAALTLLTLLAAGLTALCQWWTATFFALLIVPIFGIQTFDAHSHLQSIRSRPCNMLWARIPLPKGLTSKAADVSEQS